MRNRPTCRAEAVSFPEELLIELSLLLDKSPQFIRFLRAHCADQMIELVIQPGLSPLPDLHLFLQQVDHRSVRADALPARPIANDLLHLGRDVAERDCLHASQPASS